MVPFTEPGDTMPELADLAVFPEMKVGEDCTSLGFFEGFFLRDQGKSARVIPVQYKYWCIDSTLLVFFT